MSLQKKRLFYQATHRGTREADFVLGRFVQENLDELSPDELIFLTSFLDLSDEIIMGWLLKKAPLPDEIQHPLLNRLQLFVNDKMNFKS